MPRIDDNALDSATYMYSSTDEADKGVNPKGSGFVAGYPAHRDDLGNFHHYYAITNYHVLKGGAPVVRLNRHDGSTETRGVDITEWESNESADIAALPLSLNYRDVNVNFVGANSFVNQERLNEWDIGVGDDVFMIGLLVDEPEPSEQNAPHVRFGHVSRMPVLPSLGEFKRENGFRIDMRSRVGFSGSPVWTYRTPFSNIKHATTALDASCLFGFFGLLGIHWGGFKERWKLDGKPISSEGMSGMTVVTPAWEIKKLLEGEVFVEQRKQDESTMPPYPLQEESVAEVEADQSKARDELLKTMLNTPPKPQAEQ